MPETIRCPDCGQVNPGGSTSCSSCNFPFAREALGSEKPADPSPAPARPLGPLPPFRPRRPRPASNQALSLWLMFAFICAISVIYIAVKANLDRASQPVEGSSQEQQKKADEFRAALAKDSTSVDALTGRANILYDTGKRSQA